MAQTPPKATCRLRPDLPLHSTWTVLDTAFGDGQHLLALCDAWRADPQRPHLLHLVGFGVGTGTLPAGHPWSDFLGGSLEANGHRFHLENGRISVTLCAHKLEEALREHTFKADEIRLGSHATTWDTWTFNALARHCKRDTRLSTEAPQDWQHTGLIAAGFEREADGSYRYRPRWSLKVRSGHASEQARAIGRCAVIGAGIAGASVAHALALRGWAVTVYDRSGAPATGASGLPAGLVVPHVSADDNPRSRLSRTGVRLLQAHARKHIQHGEDWAATGAMEQRWDANGQPIAPLWHPEGAWIKPARLVQSWMEHPNIEFVGNCTVKSVVRTSGSWSIHDLGNEVRGIADIVVFANAIGCVELINSLASDTPLTSGIRDKLHKLHCMHGTLSMGPRPGTIHANDGPWPAYPCNGDGSFLPAIPTDQGPIWASGSTFEQQAERLNDVAQQHAANAARLRRLLPAMGEELKSSFDGSALRHWSGIRCVSHDRFALVGPLDDQPQPTLWISAAMGSRGLSFAALCAEILASRLGAEPLPVSDRLARSLDVSRKLPHH